MKKISFVLLFIMCSLLGCTHSPKPVAYGSDGCHFCSMTIVDKQHAAQFMTQKGRTYSFDATECMLNHLKEIAIETVALYMVNDYNMPGEFIDGEQAVYLISENIPSPMGEYLTAFATEQDAKNAQMKNGGEIFTWQELRERFK
ncbi:nitrous oxide reductase accessory protein NosL [Maribacter sp. 2304DJ31-5]|uniref:nitrous oxide reductase accessory protein NosL n=1 Tax=Maribacter sp. 2304DJ31-5 TaxID=3386273 RepID=UPI0039BCC25D